MTKNQSQTKQLELVARKDVATALGLRGRLGPTGWEPPENLTEAEWKDSGKSLGKIESGISWWIGDWWRAFKPEWGERAARFEGDWDGPSYDVCRHAGGICDEFEIGRRRPNLSFKHHREAAALPPEKADALLDWCEETIAETGEPRSTRELRNKKREVSRIEHIANLEFPEGRYGLIYCDPPWQYDFALTDNRKIENHYPTMNQEELLAFPMAEKFAAGDAMIFMWAVSPRLPQAIELLTAWGFEYITNMAWVKDKIGMGYHARAQHELLLIGRHGNVPPPAPANRFSSVIFGERGQHSRKPDEAYVRIEEGYPTLPKIEVFARNDRAGWTSWGNQLAVAAA